MPDKAFTVTTLASYWDCSVDEVYRLLRSKKLKGFKIGSAWRINPTAVKEYEDSFHEPTLQHMPVMRRFSIS